MLFLILKKELLREVPKNQKYEATGRNVLIILARVFVFWVFSDAKHVSLVKEATGRHREWLYLLVAGGFQGMVLDFVLPF